MLNFGDYLLYFSVFFGLFTGIFFLFTFFEHRKELGDPKPTRLPKVTIIVPAFNEEKTIEKTIRSLLNVNYPKKKMDIIVVDDGSTDNTFEKAKKFRKFGVRVFSKENGGKSTALNFALKRTRGELVGALDADSFISKNSIRNMVGYFDEEAVMAVTPTLKIWNPKTMLQKVQMIEYLFGVFLRKVFSFIGSIHVTPGPLTLYRKVFFDKYGGYDEDNLTEDIEVALRIQSKNYIIENSMNAAVYTVGPRTFKGLITQRRRWYRGFLDNIVRYNNLFGLRHGNLGLFILPAALLSVGVVMTLIFYGLTNLITRLIHTASLEPGVIMLKIGFFFEHFGEIVGLYLTKPIVLLSIILFSMGLTNIFLAKTYSKDKQSLKFSYLGYVLFYGFLFVLWWGLAITSKIFNIKIQW